MVATFKAVGSVGVTRRSMSTAIPHIDGLLLPATAYMPCVQLAFASELACPSPLVCRGTAASPLAPPPLPGPAWSPSGPVPVAAAADAADAADTCRPLSLLLLLLWGCSAERLDHMCRMADDAPKHCCCEL